LNLKGFPRSRDWGEGEVGVSEVWEGDGLRGMGDHYVGWRPWAVMVVSKNKAGLAAHWLL
jgi:hypothetical protein